MMRIVFTIWLMISTAIQSSYQKDISEAQFAKTLQVFNAICQSKLDISDAQIQEVKKHPEHFADDSKEKCFATCVLEMFNMVIQGKVPIDLANESIGQFLPNAMKVTAENALDTCRNSLDANVDVHCVVGYNMLKCLAANDLKFFLI